MKKKIKSQAAMEYLMTYGWAILIIALALGVLYSLGIMNPKNFLPRAPPGSCFVFRPNGPGTTDFVSLQGTCGYLPMYVASFDGGTNAYIDFGKILYLQNFSVVAWIKVIRSNEPSWDNIIGYGTQAGGNNRYGWCFYQNLNTATIVFAWGFGTTASGTTSTSVCSGLGWHYVAAVKNGLRQILYCDGKLVSNLTFSNDINYGSAVLRFGYNGNLPWNGSIANVQIYNTPLTPQEIQYLYQQGLGGAPIRLGSLVGWWPLNGDAKDYSGNNNHGTINGGVTFVQNYNPP